MSALVLDALAVYRITRLINKDEITSGLRAKVTRATYREAPSAAVAAKLATLISCPWCASIHVAVGVVVARRFAPRWWDPLAQVLAFSAVSGLIAENT